MTNVVNQIEAGVTIKLIMAEGQYKALVLDMAKIDDRLLYIGHGNSRDEAYNDALDFIEALARSGVVWV